MFARGRLGVLLGSNLPGVVYSGATYEVMGEGGLILRLLRIDSTGTQISLRASGAYSNGQSFSLFPLLTQAAAPTVRTVLQGDLGSLVRTPVDEWDVRGDVAVAQALGSCFSLQAQGIFNARAYVHPVAQPRTPARPLAPFRG